MFGSVLPSKVNKRHTKVTDLPLGSIHVIHGSYVYTSQAATKR